MRKLRRQGRRDYHLAVLVQRLNPVVVGGKERLNKGCTQMHRGLRVIQSTNLCALLACAVLRVVAQPPALKDILHLQNALLRDNGDAVGVVIDR